MPTFRVKLTVRPVSAKARTDLRALVDGALAVRDVAQARIAWVHDPDTGQIVGEWELRTRADWRTLKEWAQAQRDVLKGLATGRLTVCKCSHDDAVVLPCTDARSEFAEVLF